jgi:hypothetical protein
MKRKQKPKSAKPAEKDLFGEPVKPRLPLRKAVLRPDGRGWCIAVREPTSTVHRHIGIYETKGEAWQAIREGVGAEPCEDREELRIEVRFSVRRGIV